MSRCFPYPPPGYLAKRDNNDALIASIKLQRATEKAKSEKKAERKEKKREKKEKKHHHHHHHDKKRKRTEGKDHLSDKKRAYLKAKVLLNGVTEEAEDQRSGVTEEHGQPACSQRPCYSSDSTENSNKRRRPTLPEDGIHAHGSILRIRLSTLKQKKPEPVVGNVTPMSTLNADTTLKQKEASAVIGKEQPSFSGRNTDAGPDEEQRCSTSVVGNDCSQVVAPSSSSIPLVSKKVKTVSTLYKELFENWVAPSLQNEQMDLDDQDWLFQRKQQKVERTKVDSGAALCSRSSILWPRAQFLPEADVFALPFTVPF